MEKILVVFCASCVLVVFCAPSTKCPPGGKYFDKHLGQNGRWRCCNEICEAMIYHTMCIKKCPGYEQLKSSGSEIKNKTDPTPKPTPADTKDRTVNQPELKPPARSSSDSDPAAAADQLNPEAGGTSYVIVVSVIGTCVAILLLSVLIVVFVRKRRQQKRRRQGNGLVAGILMDTLHGRPPTEDPEIGHNLLHGSRPEDLAAGAMGGPGNAGAGQPCLSRSEGRPPNINPDADQRSQRRLGSSFTQTAKEEGRAIQVADGSSGAMAMD